MTDFAELFRSLTSAVSASGGIPACNVPTMPHVWIGRDESALPLLIIESAVDGAVPPAVELRNLRFDPVLECSIEEQPGGERREIRASVIRVTAQDSELHAYFLRTIAALLAQLSKRPQLSELARAIDHLVEIFRTLALPPASSLQGLWAELLVIRQASSPEDAVRAWHTTRRSLFDFDAGKHAVEVKSSTSGLRKHHFKLSQLRPPAGREVYVVSMLLTPHSLGPSIPDLWKDIEQKLAGNAQLSTRLADVIAQSAGVDWHHARETRFDDAAALRSTLVFTAALIPRVGDDAKPEVTDIEFVSDLSGCESVEPQTVAGASGLLSTLFGGRLLRASRGNPG